MTKKFKNRSMLKTLVLMCQLVSYCTFDSNIVKFIWIPFFLETNPSHWTLKVRPTVIKSDLVPDKDKTICPLSGGQDKWNQSCDSINN